LPMSSSSESRMLALQLLEHSAQVLRARRARTRRRPSPSTLPLIWATWLLLNCAALTAHTASTLVSISHLRTCNPSTLAVHLHQHLVYRARQPVPVATLVSLWTCLERYWHISFFTSRITMAFSWWFLFCISASARCTIGVWCHRPRRFLHWIAFLASSLT
jgi:hypothetical protein